MTAQGDGGRENILRVFIKHSAPLVFVTILFGFLMAIFFSRYLKREKSSEALSSLSQAMNYHDSLLSETESLRLFFSATPESAVRLRDAMRDGTLDYDSYRELRILRLMLSSPVDISSAMDEIYIYAPNDGGMIFSSQGFSLITDPTEREYFENAVPEHDRGTESIVHINGEGKETVRVTIPLLSSASAPIGVIAIDYNPAYLSENYSRGASYESQRLIVSNGDGETLFSSGSNEGKGERVSFSMDSQYGWRYELSYEKGDLYASPRMLFLYMALLSLFFASFGVLLVYRSNTKEREFISNVIRELRKAGADVDAEMPKSFRGDMFTYLNDSVLAKFIENDYLRLQKEAIEHRALQMQINPHFLFNTLNTISWKTIKLSGGENDASHMIGELSKLLSYSLKSDHVEGALLTDELNAVRSYIEIQRFRFRSRFSFEEDVNVRSEGLRVPPMLIQPILENSFNHGMSSSEPMLVRLKVIEEGDGLRISVYNSGPGIEEETLKKLNDESRNVLNMKSHLGLQNVRKRLEFFSHGKSYLTVRNANGGVEVEMWMEMERAT